MRQRAMDNGMRRAVERIVLRLGDEVAADGFGAGTARTGSRA